MGAGVLGRAATGGTVFRGGENLVLLRPGEVRILMAPSVSRRLFNGLCRLADPAVAVFGLGLHFGDFLIQRIERGEEASALRPDSPLLVERADAESGRELDIACQNMCLFLIFDELYGFGGHSVTVGQGLKPFQGIVG